MQHRVKTSYPGVFYRVSARKGRPGEERIYYNVFKQDGKVLEEKVGRQHADNMTPAKAAGIRAERMEGKRESRKAQRVKALAAHEAEKNKCTIAALWDSYQEANSERKSGRTDQYNYDLHLRERFAAKQPHEIITPEIDQLRNQLLKSGRSPQTVKHILGLLRRIIRYGVQRGLCPMPDPSKQHFEMPRVDNERTENLSGELLKKYLNALDNEADQNAASFLRMALFTGMRKGALMALRWDDIDFEEGFILLRGDVAKKGKTERIPLSASARHILENIERSDSVFVFPGRNGQQRKDFKRIAQRVRDAAGLPKDFRLLHGLRHAYASMLASSGQVDLYTLQKLLTHGSPQMTQRYAHLADEALHRAASVVDDILQNSSRTEKE